jgi:hypothetical protein
MAGEGQVKEGNFGALFSQFHELMMDFKAEAQGKPERASMAYRPWQRIGRINGRLGCHRLRNRKSKK